MTLGVPEAAVLLGAITLAAELIWLAVPSEASTLQRIAAGPLASYSRFSAVVHSLPAVALILVFLVPPAAVFFPGLIAVLGPIDGLATPAVRMAGAALIILGRMVTVASVSQLRRAMARDALATSGLFAVARHPGLLGMFALSFGNALVFPCAALFLGAVFHVLHMRRCALIEGASLRQRFGDAFDRYAARIPPYGAATLSGGFAGRPSRRSAADGPEPTQREVAAWFDATYRRKGLRYLRPERAYEVFLDRLGARAGERLLDVASGPGLLVGAARRRGLRARGVDLSAVAARMARERIGLGFVATANAERLPFATGSFDLLTCIGSLERFLDRPQVLAEMLRVARPDARICIMVRNSRSLGWVFWNRLLRRRNRTGHQEALPLETWEALLESAGLAVEAIHADPWLRERLRPLPLPRLPLRFANEFIFILRPRPVPGSDAGRARVPADPGRPARLRRLYDTLARFEILRRRACRVAHPGPPALRKRLRPPDGGGPETVEDLLLARLDLPPGARVLDAGCGFGATIFAWAAVRPWTFTGITTSRVQADWARREAARRGLDGRCAFRVQDYDAPLDGPFDAVVAVEALFHAPDLRRTVANLASALRSGGWLLIVEDMAAGPGAAARPEARRLLRHWSTEAMHTIADHREALAAAGLRVEVESDLTSRIPRVAPADLARRTRRLKLLRVLLPIPGIRRLAAAFLGGVDLERLYLAGAMRYMTLVAVKPEDSR